MTVVNDVEEFIRQHPGVCIYDIIEAFPDRHPGSLDAAVCRLWRDKVITSYRGDYIPGKGAKKIRTYFYTHVMSPGGRKELRRAPFGHLGQAVGDDGSL